MKQDFVPFWRLVGLQVAPRVVKCYPAVGLQGFSNTTPMREAVLLCELKICSPLTCQGDQEVV